MPAYGIDGVIPVIDPAAFVHPTAVLVMDGAVVGEQALIGAHSFVPSDTTIRDGYLALGSPAREIRALTAAPLREFRQAGRH